VGIKLSEVSIILPDNRKLFKIPTLEIRRGEKCLIEGPSGIGKTTLIHLIAGLLDPTDGYVFVDDKNLRFLSDGERCDLRRQHFGIIFQKLNLLDHLTALENVRITLRGKDNDDKARAALKSVGMDSFANAITVTLSLGEQQRVAAARILAAAPDFILADEPTSSLDDKNAEAVLDALFARPDSTLIMVSHDHRIKARFKNTFDFRQWVAQ
jgi:ABC-type lipoprotein export system ATPase subunit